ncbi:MAG: FtsQ-type POTRA domain-containing protein [Candidatus Baltobacteraceae bacterium]
MKGGKTGRRGRSAAARIRPFWLPIALAGALLAGAALFAAAWPGFYPKTISVAGNQRVTRAEILARAGIAPNRSLWLEDTGAIARRIRGIPYIATASVHRFPPALVRIDVSERVPFAIVRSAFGSAVVDRALRVLAPAGPQDREVVFDLGSDLYLEAGSFVTTRDAFALRDAYDAMTVRHIVPVELSVDRFGGLVATMRDGLRLLLGSSSDLDRKLGLVDPILAQVVRDQRRVAAIDLRAPSTPVLVYR